MDESTSRRSSQSTSQPVDQPANRHRAEAARRGPVACAVVTVSDTRTPETDVGGRLARELLERVGHRVAEQRIVPDDRDAIAAAVRGLVAGGQVQAVILTGGTGVAPRDVTPEALAPLLDRRIEGFGELFRRLSWEEVGPAAMLSRALGGVVGRVVVLAIPGSPAGVRLAIERIIGPELGHLVHLVSGDS